MTKTEQTVDALHALRDREVELLADLAESLGNDPDEMFRVLMESLYYADPHEAFNTAHRACLASEDARKATNGKAKKKAKETGS